MTIDENVTSGGPTHTRGANQRMTVENRYVLMPTQIDLIILSINVSSVSLFLHVCLPLRSSVSACSYSCPLCESECFVVCVFICLLLYVY